jgi:hypothetical protein
MADDRTARINQAVDRILEHCSIHGPGTLRQCLDGLKRRPDWDEEEVEVVRTVVASRLDTLG